MLQRLCSVGLLLCLGAGALVAQAPAAPSDNRERDYLSRIRRLTVEGRLLLCLGQEHSVDLRAVVREHPGDLERVKQAIRDSMAIKPKGHEFTLTEQPVIFRHMNATGG